MTRHLVHNTEGSMYVVEYDGELVTFTTLFEPLIEALEKRQMSYSIQTVG